MSRKVLGPKLAAQRRRPSSPDPRRGGARAVNLTTGRPDLASAGGLTARRDLAPAVTTRGGRDEELAAGWGFKLGGSSPSHAAHAKRSLLPRLHRAPAEAPPPALIPLLPTQKHGATIHSHFEPFSITPKCLSELKHGSLKSHRLLGRGLGWRC